jgi:glycine/D-amino acid oxidase-like deaminating enzyme
MLGRDMTQYGSSPWLAQFPKSRVPVYPRHKGKTDAGVVIIGGGLTGCATAYALAAAGEDVMLLEAEQIGRGATALSTGWIGEEPGVAFNDVEKLIGVKNARRAWQAWRRAALDFSALVRRLDLKCYLEPHPAITMALTPDQLIRLKKDQKARASAGVPSSLLNARALKNELAIDATAGLRAKEGATIDPYRATVGLAAEAIERGARFFERTPVRRVSFNRRIADVITATGSIRTRRVVVATGLPTRLFHSLARHFWFRSTYLALTDPVPAKVRQLLGRRVAVVRDSATPPHTIRWVDDNRVLIAGADAETVPIRLRDKTVVQRTGQLMYELSVLYPDVSGTQAAYGWSSDYARTADGLPYIGAHRNFPHQVFAFGTAGHDVTGAYLASRIITRACLGESDPADDAFGFNR